MADESAGQLESETLHLGDRWGDDITPERKAWLESSLQAWTAKARQGLWLGPFHMKYVYAEVDTSHIPNWRMKLGGQLTTDIPMALAPVSATGAPDKSELTGADVFWLAARSLAGNADEAAIAVATARLRRDKNQPLSELHLEGANLAGAHLEGAVLFAAHLEHANLEMAQLQDAMMRSANLEGANLAGATLYRAHMWKAHLKDVNLSKANLQGANLTLAHLEDVNLAEAHLESVVLAATHLERANLKWAHLEGADLVRAHLKDVDLIAACLEGVKLRESRLERVNLSSAHLEGVDLSGMPLEGMDISWAYLGGANLADAHLEGTNLTGAHLEGIRYTDDAPNLQRIRQWATDFPTVLPPADLRRAFFDRATQLTNATLGDADLGYVRVADTRWGEVNLAVVDWGEHAILHDELAARAWQSPKPDANTKRPTRQEWRAAERKQHAERLNLFREATRANRQLATVLRTQGLNDDADKFAYGAQVLQRTVLRLQGRRGAAFGSWLLDLVSGYGYQPMRSVATYAIVVLAFAAAYFILGGTHGPLSWNEAIVVSMTAFHGRGFFGSAFQPGDPQAAVAAVEALVGLLIEITFIATFTQRFFAR